MKKEFNIVDWKRNQLLESNLKDSDLKAKKRIDTILNQIIQDFPDIFQTSIEASELRFSISSALADLSLKGLLKEEEQSEYKVGYWVYRGDDYDYDTITIKAYNEEEALKKAEEDPSTRRGKKFEIIKEQQEGDPIDVITLDVPLFIRLLEYSREDAETDIDLHNLTENAVRLTKSQGVLSMDDYEELIDKDNERVMEVLKSLLEEIGYSPILQTPDNPKGLTQGLDSETLDKILLKIASELKEEQHGLWDNIRNKQKRGENPSPKNSKEYKNAVKAGKILNQINKK